MYKILIFSKYISHKKEIKVNNLTPDYVQNLIYPLVVLKFDTKEPKLFLKSQNLPKISPKNAFSTVNYSFCIREYTKTCIVLILFSGIAYIANNLGFSSILIFWGWGNSLPPNLSVNI